MKGKNTVTPLGKFSLLQMLFALFILLSPLRLFSQPQAPSATHTPRVCTGLNPETQDWILQEHIQTVGDVSIHCPHNHAYYGAVAPGGLHKPGAAIAPHGNCCPLPADDILLKEKQVHVKEHCPEDYVATGIKKYAAQCDSIPILDRALCAEDEGAEFICTKINTQRYVLGPARSGVFWGFNSKGWYENKMISKETIPIALRIGLGRNAQFNWTTGGCVGEPFGSLLVGKESKRCKGLFFRELRFKRAENGYPAGSPVIMFSRCQKLNDRYSMAPVCQDENEVGDE